MNAVRLPQVIVGSECGTTPPSYRRQRGTWYDSPKLIVNDDDDDDDDEMNDDILGL